MSHWSWSVIALGLCTAPTVWAQSSPPAASCEQQVQEQYRQLSTDGLVVQATSPLFGPQLVSITRQLRVQRNQYELKKNQAELAEQNWLQTNEQLRETQRENAALKAELEQLKGPTAQAAPPSN
jgi:chromosome segregation ATPase